MAAQCKVLSAYLTSNPKLFCPLGMLTQFLAGYNAPPTIRVAQFPSNTMASVRPDQQRYVLHPWPNLESFYIPEFRSLSPCGSKTTEEASGCTPSLTQNCPGPGGDHSYPCMAWPRQSFPRYDTTRHPLARGSVKAMSWMAESFIFQKVERESSAWV